LAVGIDTNALLRWLVTLPGDEAQSRQVQARIGALTEEVHICLPVLVEAVWVMQRTLRLERGQVAAVLDLLLANPQLRIDDRASVAAALAGFRQGGPWFADHLIAALNRAAGCSTTLTFDRAAARLEGFTRIG
jgi:predicted nucleic-acid-binding protein